MPKPEGGVRYPPCHQSSERPSPKDPVLLSASPPSHGTTGRPGGDLACAPSSVSLHESILYSDVLGCRVYACTVGDRGKQRVCHSEARRGEVSESSTALPESMPQILHLPCSSPVCRCALQKRLMSEYDTSSPQKFGGVWVFYSGDTPGTCGSQRTVPPLALFSSFCPPAFPGHRTLRVRKPQDKPPGYRPEGCFRNAYVPDQA